MKKYAFLNHKEGYIQKWMDTAWKEVQAPVFARRVSTMAYDKNTCTLKSNSEGKKHPYIII